MINRQRSTPSSIVAGYRKTYANDTLITPAKPASTELLMAAAIGRDDGAPA